jgi:hypothetical protein
MPEPIYSADDLADILVGAEMLSWYAHVGLPGVRDFVIPDDASAEQRAEAETLKRIASAELENLGL